MERERPEWLEFDREAEKFHRVWRRVAPDDDGQMVRPISTKASTSEDGNVEAFLSPGEKVRAGCGGCFSGGTAERSAVQALVAEMAWAGAEYRDLARRLARERQALAELERKKNRQGQRLGAAYFLMTGVRYWPREPTARERHGAALGQLRERFFAEERMARTLAALEERAADRCLRELYGDLARETAEMAREVWRVVERSARIDT